MCYAMAWLRTTSPKTEHHKKPCLLKNVVPENDRTHHPKLLARTLAGFRSHGLEPSWGSDLAEGNFQMMLGADEEKRFWSGGLRRQ